ncbi:MAG: hypothetical protein V1809_03775 [Planctomycetota bacterium]
MAMKDRWKSLVVVILILAGGVLYWWWMAERMCWEMNRPYFDHWPRYTAYFVFRFGEEFSVILLSLYCWGGWLGIRHVIANGHEPVGKSMRRLRWLAWCAVAAILVGGLGAVTGGMVYARDLCCRCGRIGLQHGIMISANSVLEGVDVFFSLAMLYVWAAYRYSGSKGVFANSVGHDRPRVHVIVLWVLWGLMVILAAFWLQGINEKGYWITAVRSLLE